jgi:hypothetical protein
MLVTSIIAISVSGPSNFVVASCRYLPWFAKNSVSPIASNTLLFSANYIIGSSDT